MTRPRKPMGMFSRKPEPAPPPAPVLVTLRPEDFKVVTGIFNGTEATEWKGLTDYVKQVEDRVYDAARNPGQYGIDRDALVQDCAELRKAVDRTEAALLALLDRAGGVI